MYVSVHACVFGCVQVLTNMCVGVGGGGRQGEVNICVCVYLVFMSV